MKWDELEKKLFPRTVWNGGLSFASFPGFISSIFMSAGSLLLYPLAECLDDVHLYDRPHRGRINGRFLF